MSSGGTVAPVAMPCTSPAIASWSTATWCATTACDQFSAALREPHCASLSAFNGRAIMLAFVDFKLRGQFLASAHWTDSLRLRTQELRAVPTGDGH